MPKTLTAPDGTRIIGTLENIQGTALIDSRLWRKDGRIHFDYAGETEIDWDSQTTERRPDDYGTEQLVFVDEKRREWLGNQLIETEIEDEDESDV